LPRTPPQFEFEGVIGLVHIGMSRTIRYVFVLATIAGLLSSCGFRRKRYENPIAKDTEQPDKVLFDKAVRDIEKSRYEIARLTLQTLINTYDTSEYLAKAKLAIADSWFREGGSHGLAQAEAEYKDFILFYPTMEESAEAQQKVCHIHYKQMEKADRDPLHALRAEDECRQLLVRFPNSKFAPETQQMMRNIQEVLAEHEYRAGSFYHMKGSYPAAANRLQGLIEQYPLYSSADTALWQLGDSYVKMGDRFEDKAASAYTRLVRDYPLSQYADEARQKLLAMKRPVPEADAVAFARMKYERENRDDPGVMSHFWGMFRKSPDSRWKGDYLSSAEIPGSAGTETRKAARRIWGFAASGARTERSIVRKSRKTQSRLEPADGQNRRVSVSMAPSRFISMRFRKLMPSNPIGS